MTSPSVRKLNPLTSLRFFAAAAVVYLHVGPMFELPGDAWKPLALNNGVSFFFVLSGFILTYVYGSQKGLNKWRFLLARVARIWPAHIAALVLFLFLAPPALWRRSDLGMWLANVTMVQSWLVLPKYYTSFVGVSWSISTEFAFYLCFLFLVRDWRRTWIWKLAGACLLLIVTMVVANWMDKHGPPMAAHGWIAAIMYFSPYGRLFEFVLGMSTAALWQRYSPGLVMRPVVATVVECAALLLVYVVLAHAKQWSYILGITLPTGYAGEVWLNSEGLSCWAFAVFIFVMALDQGLLSRLLSFSFPVLLGEISYSIYLIHPTLMGCIDNHPRIRAAASGWGAFSIYCLVMLAGSYLIWALIERPCRRFLTGLWPEKSNVIAVELPASMITPQGEPALPAHRGMVLPSQWGVVIAAGVLVWLLVPIFSLLPDHSEGPITMVPAPGSPYAGVVDRADEKLISGWAWNSKTPREPVLVEIYDGEKLLLTIEASGRREDLADYLGDYAHAFTCATPVELRDGQPHDLRVRVAHSAFNVENTPRMIRF